MDVSDLVTIVLVVLGGLFLLGVAVIVFVMVRFRVPPRGLVAMVGALVYLASPVDVLPELVLGPLGLVDDAGVVAVVGIWVYKLVQARRILQEAGVGRQGRRGRQGGDVIRPGGPDDRGL